MYGGRKMKGQKFIFILNSLSYFKKNAIQEILSLYLNKNQYVFKQVNFSINYPETPFNKETFLGSKLRAKKLKDNFKNQKNKVFIGLESGLVKRFNILFEEAWCCLIFKNKYFYGYSSGYKLPEKVIDDLKNSKHSKILINLEKITKISSKDTWGNYSLGLLSRKESLKEAFRNSLVSFISYLNFKYSRILIQKK